jgi:uncharacterized protein YjbI with pentapeptide repeats
MARRSTTRGSRAPDTAPEPPRLEEERALAPEDLTAGARVDDGRLVDADLSGARPGGLRLTDVAVDKGNLANLAAPDLSLRRVTVTAARLTGAQWTTGTIGDAVFRDCRIDLATFAGTTFERTTFEGCLVAQTDFREALFRSVRFDDCDLTEADLTGLRIDRCELRGCTLDRIAGLDRLRGATMPWADILASAGTFATALGIRVLEEEEDHR